tara:strand:+ start:2220 stop:2777 length:558 start_codon:yes stop_codon:yes gene_type:complete
MALKYYLWRKVPSDIIDEDVNEIPARQHPDGTGPDPNYVVVRQDLDPSVPLTSWKLNAAGDAFEDAHAGKSDEERVALNLAENEALIFAGFKDDFRRQIKAHAKAALEEITWKKERAEETDLINGNSAAMTALAQEKKAIRDLNNAREVELDAITENDLSALMAFAPKIDNFAVIAAKQVAPAGN